MAKAITPRHVERGHVVDDGKVGLLITPQIADQLANAIMFKLGKAWRVTAMITASGRTLSLMVNHDNEFKGQFNYGFIETGYTVDRGTIVTGHYGTHKSPSMAIEEIVDAFR